jgi:plastocyanin
MLKRYLSKLSLALLLSSASTYAAPFTIQLQDSSGQALQNAIVELVDESPVTPDTTLSPAIMDQVHKRFSPDLLVINAGQAVSFPNSDNIRHHVYSFSTAKPFEIKLYAGKTQAPVAFNQAGVVIVGCNIHDSMVGSIYVAKNEVQTSNEMGTVTFDKMPHSGQVTIWHPLQTAPPEQRVLMNLNELAHQNNDNIYIVQLDVTAAKPRDTFGDTFGDQSGY